MKKNLKKILILMVVALLVVVAFWIVANKNNTNDEKKEEKSEVEKLLDSDLENDYPDTPKGVVDLYSRIIKCLYGEEYSEEEMQLIAKKAHFLMDEELASHNEFEEYYQNLRNDVEEYKVDEKKISSYLVEGGDDVKYKDFQERKYAFVECTYYTKGKEGTAKVPEEYTLRMDEKGYWRILYWKMVNSNEE